MASARQTQTRTVPASGNLDVVFAPTRGQSWTFQQAGIAGSAGLAGAVGGIYVNSDFITPFVTTGDAPSGEPFPVVNNGSRIIVRFTGATAGSTVTVTIIYDDGES
jgi:hypothetical protein